MSRRQWCLSWKFIFARAHCNFAKFVQHQTPRQDGSSIRDLNFCSFYFKFLLKFNLAGDYIIDTVYFSTGWVSSLDGRLDEISLNLNNFLGFSSAQCSEGDYLVWKLPTNYASSMKSGTLKCSSNGDVPRRSFCLRYYKSEGFL